MNTHCDAAARRGFRPVRTAFALLLGAALAITAARAQAPSDQPKSAKPPEVTETIFLNNLTDQHEFQDVQTDLRNMLSNLRIYGVASQSAISVHGSAEDVAMAAKIIAELDHARKVYRITYTLTDKDSGKPAATQTFALVAASGEKTTFKQGSKVPVVTGTYDSDSNKANTQVQYLDVGLSIEVTVTGHGDVLSLRSKVEQSSLADDKSGVGPQDPVLRQSVHDLTTLVTPGKPLLIGSVDVPGTTYKQEISVVAELVK